MSRFKFAARPATFKHVVKWKDLEGASVELPVVFRTRTRKEFGALFDEMLDEAKAAKGGQEAADMTMTQIMESNAGNNAKYIMAAVESWGAVDEANNPVEFSEARVQEFADAWPAGANALMEAYRTACLEGRLGN